MARLWSAAFVLGAMASGAVAQNLVSQLNLLQAQAARSNPLQSFAVVGDYGSSGQGSATIPTTTDPQQIAAAQTAAQVVAQASAGVAARLNATGQAFVLSLGDQLYGSDPKPGGIETTPLAPADTTNPSVTNPSVSKKNGTTTYFANTYGNQSNPNSANYQKSVSSLYGQYLPNQPGLLGNYDPGATSTTAKFFPVYADHDWYHEQSQALLIGGDCTGGVAYCSPSAATPAAIGTYEPSSGPAYTYTALPTDPTSVAFYNQAVTTYNNLAAAQAGINALDAGAGGADYALPQGGQAKSGLLFGAPFTPLNSSSYEQFFNYLFFQGQNGTANLIASQTPSGTLRWYDALQGANSNGTGGIHVFALSNDPNELFQGGLLTTAENATTGPSGSPTVIANPTLTQLPAYQNLTYTPSGALTQPSGVVAQGPWFVQALANSQATWNIVTMHQPVASGTVPEEGNLNPNTTTTGGDGHVSAVYMQWFDPATLTAAQQTLGVNTGQAMPQVDLVLAGHIHGYERLYNDGITYINSGAGGTWEAFSSFCNQPNAATSCNTTYQVTPGFAGAGNSLTWSNGPVQTNGVDGGTANTMIGITQMQAGYMYGYNQINVSPTLNYLEAQYWGSTDPGGAAGTVNWTLIDDDFILKNGLISASQAATATGVTLSLANGQSTGFGVINTNPGQTTTLNATVNGPGQLIVAGGGTLVMGTPAAAATQILNSDQSASATACSSSACTGGLPNIGTSFFLAPNTQNTYSGGTYVTEGSRLSIAADGFLGASSGGLTLDQGALQTTAAVNSSRTVTLAAGGGVFQPLAPTTFGGPISGPGSLTMAGSSTLTLTGPLSYTGGTFVNSGTLAVTSTLPGSVTLTPGAILAANYAPQAGSSLSGHGTISGNLAVTGSVRTTGTPGTTTVSGTLGFAPGSSYQVTFGAPGSGDLLSVGGRATLSGGTVTAIPGAGFAGGFGSYAIVTAAGGVGGQFAGVNSPFGASYYPFLGASLSYSANGVSLVIGRGASFASAGQIGDERAVGAALDQTPSSSPVVQAVTQLNGATAPSALNALSGDIYASQQSVMQQQGVYLRDAIGSRLRQALVPASAPQVAALGPVALPAAPGSAFSVWQQGLGSFGSLGSSANANGVDHSMAGYLVGIDVPLDAWRLGFASGFDNTSFNSTGPSAQGTMTGVHLAGYAGRKFGALGIELAASNTWYSGSTTRSVTAGPLSDSDHGGIDATATQLFSELTWDMPLAGGVMAQPFADLAYIHLDTTGMTESGGAAALNTTGSTLDNGYASLGARGAMPVNLGGLALVADATLGWQHALGTVTPTTSVTFAGGSAPFTIQGTPIARDAALVGAGLHYDQSPSLSYAIGYSGQIASGATDHQFRGSLTIRF